MSFNAKEYNIERDAILRSLDVDAAIALMVKANSKHGALEVLTFSRKSILAGLHKARLQTKTISLEEKATSMAWLAANGFNFDM